MAEKKKKDSAGKDKEPQARGRGGPSSATPNERAQGRKGKGARGIPKLGKHDPRDGDSRDGGQH